MNRKGLRKIDTNPLEGKSYYEGLIDIKDGFDIDYKLQ